MWIKSLVCNIFFFIVFIQSSCFNTTAISTGASSRSSATSTPTIQTQTQLLADILQKPQSQLIINEKYYPKASDDAHILVTLQSNIQKTKFYIDGKEIETAKFLKVYINDAPHRVVAEPEGYFPKEDFIQPPYSENTIIGFTFMIQDKLPTASTQETSKNSGQDIKKIKNDIKKTIKAE